LLFRQKVVENLDLEVAGEFAILPPLVMEHPLDQMQFSHKMRKLT
jgi:hypothetical protein